MKEVQILMSTYNGEKYLIEQIESLQEQVGVKIKILVRDDGSTDRTIDILEDMKNQGILEWYKGENLKPAKSFLNLLKHAPEADYYSFCDQDDVWEAEKLIKAVTKLEKEGDERPSMYFSNTRLVDEKLRLIKQNKPISGSYTFGQALIRNNATGCTIVFNKKLLNIIKNYEPKFIPMHDYWLYLVCLAVDGKVIFDNNTYIKYRQHSNNVVGGRRNFIKEYRNKWYMLINKDATRYKTCYELKKGFYDLMTLSNKKKIDKILVYKNNISNKLELILDKDIKPLGVRNKIFFIISVIFEAY